jgi:uncharacterized protein (TIGR02001 family)
MNWRGTLALTCLLYQGAAIAEMSGSVSLVSDYRFRGVSLTGNRPALQAGLAFDHLSGAYAGIFLSNVEFADQPAGTLQFVGYGGYAQRLVSGIAIDVGATVSSYSDGHAYNYAEVYGGIAFEGMSARLAYAPRYFGQQGSAVYVELNGSRPLHGSVSIVAHAGLLHNEDGTAANGARCIVDGRVGIAFDFSVATIRVEYVGVSAVGASYPLSGSEKRSAIVLTLSRAY